MGVALHVQQQRQTGELERLMNTRQTHEHQTHARTLKHPTQTNNIEKYNYISIRLTVYSQIIGDIHIH